jgi:hypothetical protein
MSSPQNSQQVDGNCAAYPLTDWFAGGSIPWTALENAPALQWGFTNAYPYQDYWSYYYYGSSSVTYIDALMVNDGGGWLPFAMDDGFSVLSASGTRVSFSGVFTNNAYVGYL